MFCTKCGAQNAPGSRFCGKCGAPLGAADNVHGTPQQPAAVGNAYGAPYQSAAGGYAAAPRPVRPATPSRSGGSRKGVLIAGIAAALVVVTLLGCWIFGVFGGGYEGAVDDFMDALLDMDAEGVVDTVNEKVLRVYLDDDGYTKRELIREIDDDMEDAKEAIRENSIKLDYKIVYTEDMRGEDLEEVKEMYLDEYGVKITAAKIVEVEVTMKVEGYSDSMELELGVVEIGGSWYIDYESMEDALYDFL
ncbi:MAG: zinc-ribbon domain-containing protein [Oscillospiraceae bacterium]|nr:zinc-ribbon domain-containing protein [Oscillospiraceae bacterium]